MSLFNCWDWLWNNVFSSFVTFLGRIYECLILWDKEFTSTFKWWMKSSTFALYRFVLPGWNAPSGRITNVRIRAKSSTTFGPEGRETHVINPEIPLLVVIFYITLSSPLLSSPLLSSPLLSSRFASPLRTHQPTSHVRIPEWVGLVQPYNPSVWCYGTVQSGSAAL